MSNLFASDARTQKSNAPKYGLFKKIDPLIGGLIYAAIQPFIFDQNIRLPGPLASIALEGLSNSTYRLSDSVQLRYVKRLARKRVTLDTARLSDIERNLTFQAAKDALKNALESKTILVYPLVQIYK